MPYLQSADNSIHILDLTLDQIFYQYTVVLQIPNEMGGHLLLTDLTTICICSIV